MSNMNLSIILVSLGGCFVYVCSMSALGRWLAACRDDSSVAYIAPAAHGTMSA